MKKILVRVKFFALFVCFLVGLANYASAAATLMVGNGQPYASLGEAIAAAADGDTIKIIGTVTRASPVAIEINKSVTIVGDDENAKCAFTSVNLATGGLITITAPDVKIKNLAISVAGATTNCSPLVIQGDDLLLDNVSITITGNANSVYSPIMVGADNLVMKDVTIPVTTRCATLIDLQGYSAEFDNVSIEAGANNTAIYSASSPKNLIIKNSTFTFLALTAKLVSLPSPAGLALENCTFDITKGGAAVTGYGLGFFNAPANATAAPALTATECNFNFSAIGHGVNLNGYSATFDSCTFNYTKSAAAVGVYSDAPSNADLTFNECVFYMAKVGGETANNAKGVILKNKTGGEVSFDDCTLIASNDPGAVTPTTATSTQFLSSTDGILDSLTIKNSNMQFKNGANGSKGFTAEAKRLTITDNEFMSNTGASEGYCISVSGIDTGDITGNDFEVAQLRSSGLIMTNVKNITMNKNNFNLTAAGKGIVLSNDVPDTSSLKIENTELTIQDTGTVNGFAFTNLHELKILGKNKINVLADTRNATIKGILATSVHTITIDGLDINLERGAVGIDIDGTGFAPNYSGPVRIQNTNLNVSGGTGRGILVSGADDLTVTKYIATSDSGTTNCALMTLTSVKDVSITNSEFNVLGTGTGIAIAPTPDANKDEYWPSEDIDISLNTFHIGANARGINLGGHRNTHYIDIHDNDFTLDGSTSAIAIGYGKAQTVHNNKITSTGNSTFAIVIDGIDELPTFDYAVDSDIYNNGVIADGINDNFRNRIYENTLIGSFGTGIYLTNNGDVIHKNDFTDATFSSSQILVANCIDVIITDNLFAIPSSYPMQIIRISNAVISEITGNKTLTAVDETDVLVVQGTIAKAPNGNKYGEIVTYHDTTNTINGNTPVEEEKLWRDELSIYEYILKGNGGVIPPTTYSVSYDAYGGTGSLTDPNSPYNLGSNVTVLSPLGSISAQSGYAFDEWNTVGNGSGTSYAPGAQFVIESDIILYAQWKEASTTTYIVSYDANGGTGSLIDPNSPYNPGSNVTVLSPLGSISAQSGYAFDEWNTARNGGGTSYAPGEQFVIESDIILYAQWKETDTTTYTVSYDANGGTGSLTDGNNPYQTGDTVEILSPMDAITRVGYGFLHWNTEPNGSGVSYIPGNTFTITADTTLYAQWRSYSTGGTTTTTTTNNNKSNTPDPIPPLNIGEFNTKVHYAYIIGYTDGLVRPQSNITRQEAATIFFRLLANNTRNEIISRNNDFIDVDDSLWSNITISTLAAKGIILGYSNGRFNPTGFITRAEFAVIASRFDTTDIDFHMTFMDTEGHWAGHEISRAACLGWIRGRDDGSFGPNEYITRAEVAAFINRMMLRLPTDESALLPDMRIWPDNNTGAWYYLDIQEASNSHLYEIDTASLSYNEIWVEIIEDPDWVQYER